MMPVVRISDSTFSHLKDISTWLDGGTPSQTIDLIVEKMMGELDLEKEETPSEPMANDHDGVLKFTDTPALSFTRVTNARIDGKTLHKPNWGSVLVSTVEVLHRRGTKAAALVKELHVNSKVGEYDEHGYKFYPSIGISIQGQSAPDAWREARRIAEKWDINCEVKFQWGVNPKALYPNRTGFMQINN